MLFNSLPPCPAFKPVVGLPTVARIPPRPAADTTPTDSVCELTGAGGSAPTAALPTQARVDPLRYWQEHQVAQNPVRLGNALELERKWASQLGPGESKCVVGIQVDPGWLDKAADTGQTFPYLDELAEAVTRAGGQPRFLFPGRGDLDQQRQGIACLLNSGGNDVDPSFWGDAPRADTDKTLNSFRLANTRWALEQDLPFLGVCLGSQELAVADGGRLERIQDSPGPHMSHWNAESASHRSLRYRQDHGITAAPDSTVGKILGPMAPVNSIHNWSVSASAPGDNMAVVAWGMEENPTPEAIQRRGHADQIGVQFHPEFMRWADPVHDQFFQKLVRDGARYAEVHTLAPPRNPNFAAVGQQDGYFLMA